MEDVFEILKKEAEKRVIREREITKKDWIRMAVCATLSKQKMLPSGDLDVSPIQVEKLTSVLGGYYEAMERGLRR